MCPVYNFVSIDVIFGLYTRLLLSRNHDIASQDCETNRHIVTRRSKKNMSNRLKTCDHCKSSNSKSCGRSECSHNDLALISVNNAERNEQPKWHYLIRADTDYRRTKKAIPTKSPTLSISESLPLSSFSSLSDMITVLAAAPSLTHSPFPRIRQPPIWTSMRQNSDHSLQRITRQQAKDWWHSAAIANKQNNECQNNFCNENIICNSLCSITRPLSRFVNRLSSLFWSLFLFISFLCEVRHRVFCNKKHHKRSTTLLSPSPNCLLLCHSQLVSSTTESSLPMIRESIRRSITLVDATTILRNSIFCLSPSQLIKTVKNSFENLKQELWFATKRYGIYQCKSIVAIFILDQSRLDHIGKSCALNQLAISLWGATQTSIAKNCLIQYFFQIENYFSRSRLNSRPQQQQLHAIVTNRCQKRKQVSNKLDNYFAFVTGLLVFSSLSLIVHPAFGQTNAKSSVTNNRGRASPASTVTVRSRTTAAPSKVTSQMTLISNTPTSPNVEYEDYIIESENFTDIVPTNINNTFSSSNQNVDRNDGGDTNVFFSMADRDNLFENGPHRTKPNMYFMAEMQRYDGWYNNLAHPHWGSTESHLTRKAPPSYSDGVYMLAGEDRPSPRELSQALMKGEDGKASARNLTVLFAFFGQMVSSEILMASEPGCPIEMYRIKISKCDEMYDRDCRGGRTMPFHRALYDTRTGQSPNNPREQLNMVTSWIDGSFVYSTSETWLNAMRTFQNGTFKTDASGGFPPRNSDRVPLVNSPPAHHLKMAAPERMFLLGDPRTNQNPVILALGVLMFRWHNALARRVQAEHLEWSDEDVFQRTRRLVIASLQNIIMYEYLETLFDEPMPPYNGYKPDVHPGISHVFQSAAFRFGHTMIPPGLYRRDAKCNFLKTPSGHAGIRLCSTWWDAVDILPNAGLEELIMGLSSQIAEREDSVLCSDVRDKLFGPLDFSRRDLAALNIMRGRDNGLADYNTIRRYFNLAPMRNWSQINPTLYERAPQLFETLSRLYDNNLDNVDVYVGGMVESEHNAGRPGPLFRAVIKEQFVRIRDSDRFWFENQHNGIFSPEEIAEIRKIKLWDIIVNSTNIPVEAIQRNVFLFRTNDPCPQPRQMTSKVLENCLVLAGWNYFHGSELPYIMVILLLVFIPMVVAVMGYAVIKVNNRRRRKIKQQREMTNKKNYDKLYVREWLHQNHKRYVKVKIGPDQSILTVNRKGETLRKIDIHDTSSLLVEVTQDSNKPMILIRAPRDHDLVLQFENNGVRKKFLTKLESFLLNHKKTLEIIHIYRDVMLANAETKEKRQKRLEHFFREAYALTFGLKPGEKRKFEDVSNDVIMVMRTSLSRKEFAEALGMKPDSLFVKQMFSCVDKDNDGRISFQEFLDTVVLFSRGKTDNKLRIIFDMCDHDGNGVIDKNELMKMMRSLVDIAKTNSMTEAEVMELIEGMFASAGLHDKEELTYNDFKLMMSEYRGDLIAIGLDCKGAKQNFLDTSTNIARMTSFQISSFPDPEPNLLIRKWNHFITYLEENRQPIVYLFIFFVASFVLFLERFITYSYLSEHTDLRHVMGYGIAITRGSAASLSFCYSLLLLTMCRNLITKIREIPLHQYIPLDSHVQFHKIVAITGLFFTVVHTIGHCINFYHVSTQPVEHLRCLTKEMQFESNAKPTFSYWIFGTVTGLTGVLLVLIVAIIFIFAHPRIRQKAYSYFWMTHSLYVLMYILMFVHGLAKITGEPRFWIFFIIPGIIFIFDKIVSLQTKYMELDILETDLLPSDVTKVKFSRPPNFKYLSGQWVRLCCTAFRSSEYHSLTLTSAPHENYLSVHVKAQGPWTWKLRNYFDPNNFVNVPSDSLPPKIRLEGPFGGGNQDWYKYEVAVMVGGGIGVTPYASILNDLVFGTSTNRYSGVACKKVYFLWICPSHRHFEWFIDVLRDVERKDVTQVLEVHIFITQFFHKFDLRTTMLYICENHFQRISNRSMFTGLKAINHFGRPDMIAFLKFVQNQHSYVSKVGVFSCGPSALTKSISKACETVNNRRKLPYFIHQFENFG